MCKHLNVYISEQYTTNGVHEFIDGKYEGSWNDDTQADLTGYISVVCNVCGYEHTYTPKEHKPKWLLDLLSALKIASPTD